MLTTFVPQPAAARRVPGVRRSRTPRTAFTLTELLVVISIIAVLASLVTAAALKAMAAAKRTAIQTEISQLATAFEDFKSEYTAYPPNAVNYYAVNNPARDSTAGIVSSDLSRMFKKAFPNSREPAWLIQAVCGQNLGGPNLENGMNPAEAVYFWLGGFSADPEYPISGKGGPSFLVSQGEVIEDRNRRFEFDLTRLYPQNDDGLDSTSVRWFEYDININGNTQTRRINFWRYQPSGFAQPYAYFDTSRHKPDKYLPLAISSAAGGDLWIFPLMSFRQGINSGTASGPRDLVYAAGGKFQVLHAGLDDEWGISYGGPGASDPPQIVSDLSNWLLFPEGPFTGEIADNLTNFAGGELQSVQEE